MFIKKGIKYLIKKIYLEHLNFITMFKIFIIYVYIKDMVWSDLKFFRCGNKSTLI